VTPAGAQVDGPIVQLNGCSRPLARVGDLVTGTGFAHADGGTVPVTGSIAAGTPNLCAG
jgi:hypothetical protein